MGLKSLILKMAVATRMRMLLFLALVFGFFIFACWIDAAMKLYKITGIQNSKSESQMKNCWADRGSSTGIARLGGTESEACPEYFTWIHEDLRPWIKTGISREMLEGARESANFRLVVLDGRVYVEKFNESYQTRDVFTQWGVLQLLKRYPGRVPDLELMFSCNDRPAVRSRDDVGPPPLFSYAGDDETLDIVFPDWSFWGWPELSIKPWQQLLKELEDGNERMKWLEREPYAYWRGNPYVSYSRIDLLKCNGSSNTGQDWKLHLYKQDWADESRHGFNTSDLASQCTYRFKLYIEGWGWSVSEKYILACNSLTLFVKSRFYDFFTRGLMPMQHYWPIRDDDKCRSIKFAVEWGNSHKQQAQAIGEAGSSFIREELKMDYVYDYMLHLLNEYAKLLTYKPTKPQNAFELGLESMASQARGLEKKFMMESMVESPSKSRQCTLPPPLTPAALHQLLQRKVNVTRQVEMVEKEGLRKPHN